MFSGYFPVLINNHSRPESFLGGERRYVDALSCTWTFKFLYHQVIKPVPTVRIPSHAQRVRILIPPCADSLTAPHKRIYTVSNSSSSRSSPRACTSTYGIQTDMHIALAPSCLYLCLTFHPRAVRRDIRRRSNSCRMVFELYEVSRAELRQTWNQCT